MELINVNMDQSCKDYFNNILEKNGFAKKYNAAINATVMYKSALYNIDKILNSLDNGLRLKLP